MSYMFSDNRFFNTDINDWDVSNVVNMKAMFANSRFNKPLNNWKQMFFRAEFN